VAKKLVFFEIEVAKYWKNILKLENFAKFYLKIQPVAKNYRRMLDFKENSHIFLSPNLAKSSCR
jgi:hypothetical protein